MQLRPLLAVFEETTRVAAADAPVVVVVVDGAVVVFPPYGFLVVRVQ